MRLSTTPRSIHSSRSASRPSGARPGHGVSGRAGVGRTVRGVHRPFALPLRSHAVGLSGAQSVGRQSRVEPMLESEP